MLNYVPGASFAHRLDPRSKLLVQFAFVAAAFAHTTPRGLVLLTPVAGVILAAARLSPLSALWAFRVALPFLLVAPLVQAVQFGPPWVVPGDAVAPALASYRIVLVLLVSAAYVRTTPVRDSRAAIQRTVPGRVGQFFGMGVALVFRFLPLLVDDLGRIRDAMGARLGTERSLRERLQLVATTGLTRAFGRADRLSLALQARCFAWNPTLPALRFTRTDVPALVVAATLCVVAIV